jgi:hypothetical protein
VADGTQIADANENQDNFDKLVQNDPAFDQNPIQNSPLPQPNQQIDPIDSANREGGPIRSGFGPRPQPSSENKVEVDTTNLTPVAHIGRFVKGNAVSVKGLGGRGYGRAIILEVYAEGKLKVRPHNGKPGDETIVDIADAMPAAVAMFAPDNFGPGTPIDTANPPAAGTKLLAFHGGRWFEVEFVNMNGNRPTIKWPAESTMNKVPSRMVRIPPPEGTEPYDGKRYHPDSDVGLTPISQRGVYAQGSEHYLHEGDVSRKVILVQLYREQVVKVRDPASNEELFVHFGELEKQTLTSAAIYSSRTTTAV